MNNFKLDNKPKINTGFKIPDHYFDDFSAKVVQKLPKNKPQVISIFPKRKIWLYAAAVLIALLGLTIVIPFNTQNNVVLDQNIVENYLTYHTEFSDDELAELLTEEEIEKINLQYTPEAQTVEDLLYNNENLEEYMIN